MSEFQYTGPDSDQQEASSPKLFACLYTRPESDDLETVMSFDNEEDLNSSGTEWVPRNSDASMASASPCENDRNSDVWPILSKDCLRRQNSEGLCVQYIISHYQEI